MTANAKINALLINRRQVTGGFELRVIPHAGKAEAVKGLWIWIKSLAYEYG